VFQIDLIIGCSRDTPRSIVVCNPCRGVPPGPAAWEHGPADAPADEREEATCFLMSRSVHDELLSVLGSIPPEACGMLLGPKSHRSLITHFVRDETGTSSPASFRIDGAQMTEAIRPFVAAGLDIKGIAHSHPSGCYRPSEGDMVYLRKLFTNRRNASAAAGLFYFPIISDGQIFHFAYEPSAGKKSMRPAKLSLL